MSAFAGKSERRGAAHTERSRRENSFLSAQGGVLRRFRAGNRASGWGLPTSFNMPTKTLSRLPEEGEIRSIFFPSRS